MFCLFLSGRLGQVLLYLKGKGIKKGKHAFNKQGIDEQAHTVIKCVHEFFYDF